MYTVQGVLKEKKIGHVNFRNLVLIVIIVQRKVEPILYYSVSSEVVLEHIFMFNYIYIRLTLYQTNRINYFVKSWLRVLTLELRK